MNDNKILMIYSSKKIAIISLCIARVKISLNTELNSCYIFGVKKGGITILII